METLYKVALALVIVGAINWGLVGLFQFDLVATIFGSSANIIARIIYIIIALCGCICIGLLFKHIED